MATKTIKVTANLYNAIWDYNLNPLQGFSAESFSSDKDKQAGFNMFLKSYESAKKSGSYYIILISDDANELYAAKHCIENIRHFASNAGSEPAPALFAHCNRILINL